ncbi:hypothetical protein ACFX1T_019872 [Malus domestica]
MEDNNKFSKASHYLDQDSVKQNQFMVPSKSFNSKALPTKASSMENNYKFSKLHTILIKIVRSKINSWYPTKASTSKLHLQNFNSKASPTKASPIKA